MKNNLDKSRLLYFMLLILVSTLGFCLYDGGEYSRTIQGLITFYKYGLFLILPTMMLTVAVYFLLNVISNGYLLPVMIFFMTYVPVIYQENIKSYTFKVLIRLNGDPARTPFYGQHQAEIAVNRICVFLLSFIVIWGAAKLCRKGLGPNSQRINWANQ